jgi:hypothetical protein
MTDKFNPTLVISILALLVSFGGVLVSFVGVLVSYFVATKYGDLAAVEVSQKLRAEEINQARLTAFRSLLNEVERIQKIVDRNRQLNKHGKIQAVTRMPVAAFETAFVAGRPGLDADEELMKFVTDYLACADSINSLVDIYPASMSSPSDGSTLGVSASSYAEFVIQQVIAISTDELPGILERLRILLQEEIQRV